jgi:hypothetical protein
MKKRPFGCVEEKEQFTALPLHSFCAPVGFDPALLLPNDVYNRKIFFRLIAAKPQNFDRHLKRIYPIKGGHYASQNFNQAKIQQRQEK